MSRTPSNTGSLSHAPQATPRREVQKQPQVTPPRQTTTKTLPSTVPSMFRNEPARHSKTQTPSNTNNVQRRRVFNQQTEVHGAPATTDRMADDDGPQTQRAKHRRVPPAVPTCMELQSKTLIESIIFPKSLTTARDFRDLHTATEIATRFCTNVFHAAIGVMCTLPSPDGIVELSGTVVRIGSAFDRYSVCHRQEMENEIDLTLDDATPDRVEAAVSCFIAATTALVAGSCIADHILLDPPVDEYAVFNGRGAPSPSPSPSLSPQLPPHYDHNEEQPREPIVDTRHNGIPFTELTALSFGTIRSQHIAQTAKRICEYNEWDISEAFDAISLAWHRIRIDEDVFSYVSALRLQFGLLMLAGRLVDSSGSGVGNNGTTRGRVCRDTLLTVGVDVPSISEERGCARPSSLQHENAGCLSENAQRGRHTANAATEDDGRTRFNRSTYASKQDTVILPSSSCIRDMTAIFNSFTEMRVLSHRCPTSWSPLAVMCLWRDKTPPETSAQSEPSIWSFSEAAGNIDAVAGAISVARMLMVHATESDKFGSVPQLYSQALFDSHVTPLDAAIISSRNPGAVISGRSVVRKVRGYKYFEVMFADAMKRPKDVLAAAITRLESAFIEGKGLSDDMHNRRSLSTNSEDIAALCCMQSLFNGRYGIDWVSRFVVKRRDYRSAKRKHEFEMDGDVLPVIAITLNTYDVIYRGRVLKTSCVFESIAWWLAIVGHSYSGEISASNIGGVISIHAKKEKRIGIAEVSVTDITRCINVANVPRQTTVIMSIKAVCDVAFGRALPSMAGGMSVIAKGVSSCQAMVVDKDECLPSSQESESVFGAYHDEDDTENTTQDGSSEDDGDSNSSRSRQQWKPLTYMVTL